MRVRDAGGLATAAATGLAVLAIALYVGLIPAASWGSDEFVTFAHLRDDGFRFFLERLLAWSPRPVSDGILWGYERAVAASGRQLIVPFLLLIWSTLPIAALMALGVRSATAWLVTSAILALFLLGHPVAEVFYWPMGAGAYVLGLAAITYVVLRLSQARRLTGWGAASCVAAMLVAAGSSELGIVFVAILCVAMFAVAAVEASVSRRALAVRRIAWLLIPLAASLILGGLLATGRVAQGIERMVESPVYYHRPWPSLLAAAARLGREITSTAIPSDVSTPRELLDRVLFVAGLTFCLRAGRIVAGSAGRLFAVAVALGGAAYVSIASAFAQFGFLCCERHATVRACLFVLMLVVLAFALSRVRLLGRMPRSWAAIAGPVLVGIAVLLPLVESVPAIREDYASEPARVAARDANWRSGRGPAATPMTYRLLSHGRIVDGFGAPTGRNILPGPASGFALGVMQFFRKSEVLMVDGP